MKDEPRGNGNGLERHDTGYEDADADVNQRAIRRFTRNKAGDAK